MEPIIVFEISIVVTILFVFLSFLLDILNDKYYIKHRKYFLFPEFYSIITMILVFSSGYMVASGIYCIYIYLF